MGVIALGELGTMFLSAGKDADSGKDALVDYQKTLEELANFANKTDAPGTVVKMLLQQKGFAIKADKEILDEIKKREKERKDLRDKRFGEQQVQAELIKQMQEKQHIAEIFRQDERRASFLKAKEELKKLADEESLRLEKLSAPFQVLSQTLSQAILQTDNLGDAFTKTFEILRAQVAAKAFEILILSMLGVPVGGQGATPGGIFGRIFGVAHKGGKITKNGVQSFNSGGMVQGRDNVPILAQAGEFVIKRDSAESIGLNTLNQINETGQAGNLNLHFSGPITNADYVRDVIVPEIQKATGSNLA